MLWQVVLPERSASYLCSAKPKATIIFASGTDQEERFSVPVLVAKRMKKKADSGELTDPSRTELLWHIGAEQRLCAKQRVERLVNAREYSSKELGDKLRRDGYWSQVVQEVIEQAVSAGLISDRRFADAYVRGRLATGWGLQRIERELKRRGIEASEVLVGWPDDYVEADQESERAYQVARRRRLTGKNDYQKLVRFLCSRGFSMHHAIDAARRVLEEQQELQGEEH